MPHGRASAMLLLLATTASAQSLFSPPTQMHSVGGDPITGVFVADVDSDGHLDVVTTQHLKVRVFLGDGLGGIAPPSAVITLTAPLNWPASFFWAVFGAEDLEGDGDRDLLVCTDRLGFCALIQGPPGVFTQTAWFGPNLLISVNSLWVGDVDGNGTPEVVSGGATLGPWASMYPGQPYPLVGSTAYYPASIVVFDYDAVLQTFAPAFTHAIPLGTNAGMLDVGDFDGDGLKDICFQAPTTIAPSPMQLLRQTAPGAFALAGSANPFPTSPLPNLCPTIGSWMTVADFDADGRDDAVVATPGAPPGFGCAVSSIDWFPGGPGGSFGTVVGVPCTGGAAPVWGLLNNFFKPRVVDIDLDGVLELHMPNGFHRLPSSTNAGSGTAIVPGATFVWQNFGGGQPGYVPAQALGDFDGDGDLDVAVADRLGTFRVGIAKNAARIGPGCAGVGPMVVGTATPGNPAFTISLSGLAPGAASALGVSFEGATAPIGGCILRLDTAALLLPTTSGLGLATADANGYVSLPLPLPNLPAMFGATFFTQWIVEAPGGPIAAGWGSYVLSDARRVVIW